MGVQNIIVVSNFLPNDALSMNIVLLPIKNDGKRGKKTKWPNIPYDLGNGIKII